MTQNKWYYTFGAGILGGFLIGAIVFKKETKRTPGLPPSPKYRYKITTPGGSDTWKTLTLKEAAAHKKAGFKVVVD